jgi:hypothetical protein
VDLDLDLDLDVDIDAERMNGILLNATFEELTSHRVVQVHDEV